MASSCCSAGAVGASSVNALLSRDNSYTRYASGLVESRKCSFVSSSFLQGNPLRQQDGIVRTVRKVSLQVEAKGKRSTLTTMGRRMPNQQQPRMPEFDPKDDTPKFVLFIRVNKVPIWYPFSIVTGGTSTKLIVAAMKSEFGRKLYGSTLTRNIGNVIYNDEKAVQTQAVRSHPHLKGTTTGFEYGYKIVDTSNAKAAFSTSGVVKIPPKEELSSVLDKARNFFTSKVDAVKDSFGSISPLGGTPDTRAKDDK